MSGSSAFKRSLGHFLKKIIPYSEILGLTIFLQIYPFLSQIIDERGVIFSLMLHPAGLTRTTLRFVCFQFVLSGLVRISSYSELI